MRLLMPNDWTVREHARLTADREVLTGAQQSEIGMLRIDVADLRAEVKEPRELLTLAVNMRMI